MNEHLTIRETQIVLMFADGATWNDIRQITGMCHSTLKNHIQAIGKKWNTHGRTEIVAEAWRRGLGKEY